MKQIFNIIRKQFYISLVLTLLTVAVFAQGLPESRPERVGLSSERLDRIDKVIKESIDQEEIAGGVGMVARHGRVAYLILG